MASISSTPSRSARKKEYDIFLSFRGTRTCKTFVDYLHKELQHNGIRTFKDDEELEKGERIEKLLQIIKESQFAIVVFSKDNASAKWCLEEIVAIMDCEQQYGKGNVIPIFYDVEPSVVGNQTESFAESLKRHEENTEKAKVERWKEALKKVGEISGYLQNDFNGFEAECVERVTNDILTRLNQSIQASSTVLENNFVGLESRLTDVDKLLTQEPNDVQFIGIWGMGGIGKTTIATVVFNNFSSQFNGACFLSDVKNRKITELQENLLKTILKAEKMEISNEVDGMVKIEQWLGGKKVLIVLDDVDKGEQLEKLARRRDWFGKGSRVIITTRDAGVLHSHGVDKKYVYEVHALEYQKAIQLFSCYAFKSQTPATGFELLSGWIVHYCKGLPLALKVLGSSLYGLEVVDQWVSALEELKGTPVDDIHGKLKISFDRLDSKNKEVFLHIACFFRYHKEEHVKDVLKSCNLLPALGLRLLIEKSLISVVEYGRIEMHDLIQEMGWHFAKQENPRSRVWEFKEVDDVLSRKMDPKHIQCIVLPYTCGFWWQNDENISSAFETLKIIIGKRSYNEDDNNFDLVVKANYQLPSSLELIHFPDYPFPSLPTTSFHPSGMDDNSLELPKELNKLTYLNLSSSYSLLETPNFDMMPNLEKLYLSGCEKLVEIHPSVGRLEKLVLLDLSYCRNLKKLPKFIQVSSLQFLKLEYCSELEHFPEIQANMPRVLELNLEYIGIREIPSSTRHLCGLTKLRLCGCEYLASLSDDLCELKSLKILELRDCGQLESLPENLGNLSNLEELHIFGTAIFQLPSSITQLSSLECLCWGGNQEVQEFYEERSLKFVPSVSSLRSLKRLQLSDFHTIDEGLPSDIEYLVSLEYLSLRESHFVDLPESFSQLPHLQYLDIKGCRQLKEFQETIRELEEQPDLPKLPQTTRELYADSCFASRRNITKLLAECPELHAVAFSYDGNHPCMGRPEYFLSRMCIRFPLPRISRKTPFSVNYSLADESPDAGALRLFQYRCYQSNGISIDLTNHSWYCDRFVGFAVYFISSGFDTWGPHSYKDIHCVEHCTVIAKLSHKNNRNEALQRKCVILNANDGTYEEIKGHICFAYIPFSSLCPESSVTPNNFSRFEVKFMNLKATADWGCSLLYQRKKRPSLEDICSCTHTLASQNDICGECAINDMGPLGKLEYKNFSGKIFGDLPGFISKLRLIQYLDISGCKNVKELPKLPPTIRELYAAYNRILATEDNIAELATKYSKLSSVSFSQPMYFADDMGFLKPWELAKKFIPITQPFLNRNTPYAVTYPFDDWSDDYNIGRCFKYPHNNSNKISISLDPNWYNHNFVGFVVCFQFSIKVRWESHPHIQPFRRCKLITKLIHKDNGSEPLQIECVIGRLYDEEFCHHFEDSELVCFAYIPFSSLWPKSKAIIDTTTPNHYLVFEAAFLEFSKHFSAQDWEISTDWSCGLLYSDDESLIEELQQKRENGSSESDSEEEEEEEEDDEEEEGESIDGDEYVEYVSDGGHSSDKTYGLMASTSSVTASPSTQGWAYDVFLSFREDSGTFIDHLYHWLEQKEISTFKDDNLLEKRDCISPSLRKAIQQSRIFIIVFSKGYASSKWCLEELATIMKCQEKSKEQVVVPIFYAVECSDVGNQRGSFGDSFKELEKMVNDDEGKVRRWREALKRAVDLKGHHLQDDYNGYEAKCAEVVAADIRARLNLSNQASPAFEGNLVGLESRVNSIGNWLRLVCDDDDVARFIGICGMGGIGKTTIAMAVFNKFSSQFDGACFLADIRQHNAIELQKTLITTILKDKSGVEISNVQDGMAEIRIRLQGKKILIVLDDVDGTEQLEKLAGGRDWFGRGSRVIITIRDAAVLHSHGVVEKYIYEVQTLEEQEAIQLFKLHAFKKEPAKIGVEELCGSIVYYCKGLPLALKVLGSSLCGLEPADWEGTLEELKGTPNDDIDTKLKICFDRLDSNSKNIFLYIACFFRHEREEYVKDVLKSCDLQAFIGMRILIEKSLISVLEGRIEMHDLIQEMGWHIASLDRPRSRIWQLKDVDDVLSGKRDPNDKEEGILLPSAGDINEENISELKWLDFKFYPFTSLPESFIFYLFTPLSKSFIPSKLVWFSLHHSYLENCSINQKLDKLIYLDLSSSYSLLETPDFDWMPNLMRLNLSDCQKLKMVHSSIGNLRKLILLDLSKCHDLERLPSFNQVSSLRSLNLLGCIRLEHFPEIETRTPHLVELDLKMVGIKELSSSMQKLHGLTRLCLDQCPHLVCLCNDMCELKSLKVLEIKNCKNLKSLPENLDGLISLEYLNFQGCCFDSLPESFSQLTCLQYLSITDCEIPKELPKFPANIKELYADCGFKIAELAIQYSKLNLVSFSTGDQHGVVTSLAKKFIHFPLHRNTPFCASYRINSVDLEKSKMLRTFKYRQYKSNGICINLDSSWYSKIFMGFVVCFFEKKGNIWRRHSYQAIDNSIRSCTVIVKLSHKDNKDEVLQIDCVIAVSSFDNSDIYGTVCCAYIPVRSLWGESKAIKDYSRFEVQFMNFKSSADWGCSLLYERQIGATKHKGYHGGTDSGLTTDDIGCLSSLGLGMEYLNLNRRDLACLPKLTCLRYLDISGCRRLIMLPTLPPTIKELYAHSNLASESNIAKLAITYPELYSVSFSHGYATVSAEELARKFVHVPIQNRNSPFVVTYPACDDLADIDTKRWFKYTSHCSHDVSINLKSSWYNRIFMGFVVCFLLQGRLQRWESHPDILPFRHCKVIAKLIHKDNANEVLQTDCVIGRLYDEEFDDGFEDCQFICFAYIPSSSLLSKYEGDPNDYSVFEVAFLDSSNSSDWSCGLLYEELLSEAIRSNIYTDTLKSQQEIGNESEDEEMGDEEDGHEWKQRKKACPDKGPHITKSCQLTEILLPLQCQMVSMPECFDAKVARLLYTKSGVGIMALNLDGILKLWEWPHNKQNPSAKATANIVPQHWQTNSGLLIDVSGINTMEVFPCLALSSDGYFVALAFGEKISLSSMNTFRFQEMTTFKLPSASTCLAHDPCAYEIIAIGTKDSTIYLYNFAKEKVITKLKGHQNCITGLAFSTNPYMLVSSGADAQLCKWNILGRWKKRISVRIQLHAREVFSGDTQVMFHVDQLHLLVTHETQLAIYDASKMERISQWIPHGSLSTPISSATYSSNSLLVYASFNDGSIGVFDAHNLRLRCCIAPSAYLSQTVPDRSGGVYPVAIAAHPQKTNQFAIGLTNGSVKVIEPQESERKWGVSPTIDNEYMDDEKTSMTEDSNEESSMTEDSNEESSIMAEDSDEENSMIEDRDEETPMTIINWEEMQSGHYHCETMTSQQELGQNRTKAWELIEIVDEIQCKMVSMPECFDAKVAQILYTKSGVSILALSSNGIHKQWKWFHHEQNPSRKATANSLPQHWQTYSGLQVVSGVNLVEVVPCTALPNDGSFIALAVGRKVSLSDMETFEEKVTFMCQSTSTFLAFHPRHNNILAIGMEDSTINIYNVWDKEVRVILKGHRKRITGLAFSTNLEMLVSSGADAQLCAWSIDTWQMRISVLIQLPASELEVPSSDTQVMFHADQLHLLVTHETQLAVYDASKMECISQWIPHGCLYAPISFATYSCNNQLVYASFKDGNIGVLDANKLNSLRLRCRIAPSAYLSHQTVLNSEGVYAVVIAAHPQEPNQLAIGLTDGSVKVIEPLESEGEWGISPPVDIEILNESEQCPANEDCEVEVEANQSSLLQYFWQFCSMVLQGIQRHEEEDGDEDEDTEEGEDGGLKDIEDCGGDDTMAEDSNSGHRAESPIDISDDESKPSEYYDFGEEGESIDGDADVEEYESNARHSSENEPVLQTNVGSSTFTPVHSRFNVDSNPSLYELNSTIGLFTPSIVVTNVDMHNMFSLSNECSLDMPNMSSSMSSSRQPLADVTNGKEGEDEERGESLDGDEDVEEYEAKESNVGHVVEVAMSEHNDLGKEGEDEEWGESLYGDEDVEEYEAKESNVGHVVEVAMSEHNDLVNKDEEEEEEDKQRKKVRLDNNDKEDIIIISGKQNKGKNEQNDGRGELLATNVQPLVVDDDVFQRLGDDCKHLYILLREGTIEYNVDYIDVELDANIFHHNVMKNIFVMIEDIKDLFTMNWLDVSIIQVFIKYLYQLCKEFAVSSIGFMCPTQIAKVNVDMNLEAVMEYLHNTISKLQDKTFILAPYHQVNHWLLLVICTSSRMVYVLDPMQCDRDLEIKPVLNMVFRRFTNQQGRCTRWKNIKCPCQPGSSECGYYVMRYMYDICRKYFAKTLLDEAFQETEVYSYKEIDEIRNMWAKYFINECL